MQLLTGDTRSDTCAVMKIVTLFWLCAMLVQRRVMRLDMLLSIACKLNGRVIIDGKFANIDVLREKTGTRLAAGSEAATAR